MIGGWDTTALAFKDRQADWISPLPATVNTSQDASNGVEKCPTVPNAEKLIFVSHLKTHSSGVHTIEIIADNIAEFRMWKAADATQEIHSKTFGSQSNFTVNLNTSTTYSFVISIRDDGVGAAGLILSVQQPDGGIIKRTQKDGSWCVFRVDAITDLKSYVPPAANCRRCFTGI